MILHILFSVALMVAFANAAPDWRVLSGEYKSYRQIGDQIEAEYEKLHPDGSITRRVASGDINKGLTFNNYQIDPFGNVHQLEGGDSTDRLGYGRPSGDSMDHLGPARHSGHPRSSGMARWKPEQPRMADVKFSKNPLKDFFKDIFSW